jgi:hypothetical protein
LAAILDRLKLLAAIRFCQPATPLAASIIGR